MTFQMLGSAGRADPFNFVATALVGGAFLVVCVVCPAPDLEYF